LLTVLAPSTLAGAHFAAHKARLLELAGLPCSVVAVLHTLRLVETVLCDEADSSFSLFPYGNILATTSVVVLDVYARIIETLSAVLSRGHA